MRTLKLISLLGVSLALTATASAQFSVSGGGSAIPASGTGGGGTYPGILPPSPAVSCVTVPGNVTSITSIQVDGLAHTWAGDLQMTLADPNGVEHLIFLRPGFLNTSNFGTSGDFTGGTYTFVESGGSSLPTSSNGLDITAGTYNQTFSSGGTTWPSGTAGINNTPMSAITGPQGDWCLKFYDWGGGDTGSFSGWTLNGESDGNECYLMVGDRPGNAVVTPDSESITTQLNQVNHVYPVLLDSMPEFVIPQAGHATYGSNGLIGFTRSAYRTFAVEVDMYNPEIFPGHPHHNSNGLLVYIDGYGNVTTVPYGNGTMAVWAQTGTNSSGESIVKFPFTMPQ